MSIFDVTSVSSKGQIVIPNKIREYMHLEPGTKLLVVQDGDNTLKFSILVYYINQFTEIISIGEKIRSELNLKKNDIEKAIQEVRKEKNASRS